MNKVKNSKNSNVRIISGRWRGRKIKFPTSQGELRPTPDRVRETLFNWLSPVINDSNCLDLFAGSGALSFEALSRGASKATLVERDIDVCKRLRLSSEELGCKVSIDFELIQQDVLSWLASKKNEQYDVIFLDPPYGATSDLLLDCCKELESASLLKKNGYIYFEHNKAINEELLPKEWSKFREHKAGQVNYYLYSKM